jgi:HlyD family secretion protein
MKRKLIYLIIAALVILALFLPGMLESLDVRASSARRATLRVWVEERGRTSLPLVHKLSMPVSGRLQPIALEEGDKVEKGQVLASIEAADFDSDVGSAESQVHELESELSLNARKNLEELALEEYADVLESFDKVISASREKEKASAASVVYSGKLLKSQEESYAKKASSGQELWQAQLLKAQAEVGLTNDQLITNSLLALRSAFTIFPRYVDEYTSRKKDQRQGLEARHKAARIALERSQRDRSRLQLKSPVTGVLLRRHEKSERALTSGSPLFEIGRPGDLQVSVDILTQDAVLIRAGNVVEIFGSGLGGRRFAGKVLRIKPRGFTKLSSLGVEQQRVEVVVGFTKLPSASELALGIGYRLRVRIFTDEKPDALLVPKRTLIREAEGAWAVYRIVDGRARKTKVRIGLGNDDDVEILEGLSVDDRVIVSPSSKIAEGARVRGEG